MSDHVLQTLDDVKQNIEELTFKLQERKRFANMLAEMAGIGTIYEVEESAASDKPLAKRPVRGDEFVTDKAITAFRLAFEMADTPLDVNQLYEMLIQGGYVFDTKSDTNAKNSIRVTLVKNSSVFHKLSNGKYGLLSWYGKVAAAKRKGATAQRTTEDDEMGAKVMEKEFAEEDQEEVELK